MNRHDFASNKKRSIEDVMPTYWVRKKDSKTLYDDGRPASLNLFGNTRDEKGNIFWYIDKDHFNAILQEVLLEWYEPA